jgi:hypothetical protein
MPTDHDPAALAANDHSPPEPPTLGPDDAAPTPPADPAKLLRLKILVLLHKMGPLAPGADAAAPTVETGDSTGDEENDD